MYYILINYKDKDRIEPIQSVSNRIEIDTVYYTDITPYRIDTAKRT